MGERLDRTQEVAGSSPASSTSESPAIGGFSPPAIRLSPVQSLVKLIWCPSEAFADGRTRPVGSPVFEMYRAAIQADLAEQLAAPRRWAMIAAIAAAISAAAVVITVIASA